MRFSPSILMSMRQSNSSCLFKLLKVTLEFKNKLFSDFRNCRKTGHGLQNSRNGLVYLSSTGAARARLFMKYPCSVHTLVTLYFAITHASEYCALAPFPGTECERCSSWLSTSGAQAQVPGNYLERVYLK